MLRKLNNDRTFPRLDLINSKWYWRYEVEKVFITFFMKNRHTAVSRLNVLYLRLYMYKWVMIKNYTKALKGLGSWGISFYMKPWFMVCKYLYMNFTAKIYFSFCHNFKQNTLKVVLNLSIKSFIKFWEFLSNKK